MVEKMLNPMQNRKGVFCPSCNCIQELKKLIKVIHNAAYVYTRRSYLEWGYKPYTEKTGEPSKYWTHEGTNFRFCPICGKPYKEFKDE